MRQGSLIPIPGASVKGLMADHNEVGAAGAEARGRMLQALRDAVARAGGTRRLSGLSLIAFLCASAVAPPLVVGPVVGSIAAAWLATAGAVGSNVLADVIISVVGRWSNGAAEDAAALEAAVAGEFEARMAGSGREAAALRSAVAVLLRKRGAQQVLLEAIAEGDSELQRALAQSVALLAGQYAEFAFVGEEIRQAVWAIDASLRTQRAELRVQGERSREQSLMLSQVLETMRRAAGETDGGSDREAAWQGCPYMGLLPFSHREARIFYGRKDLTSSLCQALAERLGGGGLLLVTGASGAGKSSLLSAGLLPALSRDVLASGSGRWPFRMLTPTSSPLRELAAHLADLAGKDPQAVLASLSLNPARAADLAADSAHAIARTPALHHAAAAAPRLVLIVDQFEELFTLTPPDEAGLAQRAAFIQALHAAATVPVGPARQPAALVAVSIRGDFLDQAFVYPALAQAYADGAFVVGPMTDSELRSTITGPAAEARLHVESDLVDEVMWPLRRQTDSIEARTAVLPLVSEVMAATWENREGDRLTLRAYHRAGGVSDAVNNGARAAFQSLEERLQPIARTLFLRLTLVAEDGRIARRHASRADLYRATGQPEGDVDAVIEVFAARRLLVLERDKVEIPHDALLHSWSDLQGWLDEDRGDHAVYARLAADAESWQEHGEDHAYLYRGGRLDEIARAQARWVSDPQRYPVSSPTATRFLAAGRMAEDARRAAENARVSRLRRMAIGLAVLTLAAGSAAITAGVAVERARHDDAAVRAEAAVALSRQLAAEALNVDRAAPYTARQLAAAAWAVSPTTEAGQAAATLLGEQTNAIPTHAGSVSSVAFNPTGTALATAGSDGTVRLWNPANQRQIGTITATAATTQAANPVLSVAFNPAGTVLATARRQIGTTISAATTDPAPKYPGYALGLAFNRAGTVLATAGGGGTVKLWDPATQRQIGTAITAAPTDPATHAPNGVLGLAFNRAGNLLATADGDGTVKLWDPLTRHQIGTTITATTPADGFSNPASVNGVAFNLAGTVLATAGGDGTVRLWDPATHHQIGTTITNTVNGAATSLAFNPTGTVLAAAGSDGVVRLWNPATQQQIDLAATTTITANGYEVRGVAFNPAGTMLATVGDDGMVRLWNPTTRQQIGNTINAISDDHSVYGVAFNPTGTVLATADGDGTVRLWNPLTQRQIGTTITAGKSVQGVAFNPPGTMLATAGDNGTVRLWNPTTQQQIGAAITVATAGYPVYGVAFNPAGTMLATAGGDGTVRLWNAATRQPIGTITTTPTPDSGVSGVAFNPGDATLASADGDGNVRLWNLDNRRQIGATIIPATFGSGAIGGALNDSVAFNPTGTVLATAGGDGTVRFWNPATQQQIGTTTTTPGNVVNALAFNPAGTLLATAGSDGRTKLIDTTRQTDAGPLLCQEYGLPSTLTWSEYAGTSLTEPGKCS